jgi:hypothetical protein
MNPHVAGMQVVVNIPARMRASINDHDVSTSISQKSGQDGSGQAGAHNDIIGSVHVQGCSLGR